MLEAAPVSERGGVCQEQQIAARHEGIRQPSRINIDLNVMRQRVGRDLRERIDVDQVILAKALAPSGEPPANLVDDNCALAELGAMPLAIIKSNGLDPLMAAKGEGKAGCRILPARK
jgi:hypothetical protein